ncbi:MAG: lipoate--protein ligase family protein [Spirochaetia bacterium]|nr:lipoate--protein ligase family protein [Spirochaetia bacterium]
MKPSGIREIRIDPPCSGIRNMDLDRENFLRAGDLAPDSFLVRIYEWESPTLSLGISQSPNTLNLPYCRSKGISWVQRLTGGKAVLHEKELTYSVAAPLHSVLFGDTLYTAYLRIGTILRSFLRDLGIEADMVQNKSPSNAGDICFAMTSIYEIEVGGKKLVGSAQKRGQNAFLQHGSIPVHIRPDAIRPCLLDSEAETVEALCLSDLKNNLQLNELKEKLASAFRRELG